MRSTKCRLFPDAPLVAPTQGGLELPLRIHLLRCCRPVVTYAKPAQRNTTAAPVRFNCTTKCDASQRDFLGADGRGRTATSTGSRLARFAVTLRRRVPGHRSAPAYLKLSKCRCCAGAPPSIPLHAPRPKTSNDVTLCPRDLTKCKHVLITSRWLLRQCAKHRLRTLHAAW